MRVRDLSEERLLEQYENGLAPAPTVMKQFFNAADKGADRPRGNCIIRDSPQYGCALLNDRRR